MNGEMVLPVVKYGTPVLRQKGAAIESITPAVRKLIAEMLDTMYAAKGIGLAAQQVGVAVQLTVVDVRGATDRPSTLEIDGAPVDVAQAMPLVLVNPKVTPAGEPVVGPEGCLSFPEIYVDVVRPEAVEVRALDAEGEPVQFRCGGLLARVIQHELDHLHGILFIDRISKEAKEQLRPELELLRDQTRKELEPGPASVHLPQV
jgi:peptide deformylase